KWSRRQLTWQQDLLRRIALGSILTTTDYRLYADAALREELNKKRPWFSSPGTNDADEQFEALSEVHLSQVRVSVEPVSINHLLHVRGANDLAPGACLEFESAGLTIIAGKNGSGKSGFTRILKQVAASRAAEKII